MNVGTLLVSVVPMDGLTLVLPFVPSVTMIGCCANANDPVKSKAASKIFKHVTVFSL